MANLPAAFDGLELLRPLGEGGCASLFLCLDRDLQRQVAVKVLRGELLGREGWEARFLREMRIVGGLRHPHILSLYRCGLVEGLPYLVMEYVEGGDLRRHLNREGAVEAKRALTWMKQAASGLAEAHRRGVVHRDVKPENLLVDGDAGIKVADFGLARLLEGEPWKTAEGIVVGSPAYMAPEARMGLGVDPRADVWALGVTLHELLTGRRPSDGPQWAVLPPLVHGFLRRALHEDPGHRWPDGSAMEKALASLEASLGDRTAPRHTRRVPGPSFPGRGAATRSISPSSSPSTVPPPAVSETRKNGRRVAGALALVLGLLVAIFIGRSSLFPTRKRASLAPGEPTLPSLRSPAVRGRGADGLGPRLEREAVEPASPHLILDWSGRDGLPMDGQGGDSDLRFWLPGPPGGGRALHVWLRVERSEEGAGRVKEREGALTLRVNGSRGSRVSIGKEGGVRDLRWFAPASLWSSGWNRLVLSWRPSSSKKDGPRGASLRIMGLQVASAPEGGSFRSDEPVWLSTLEEPSVDGRRRLEAAASLQAFLAAVKECRALVEARPTCGWSLWKLAYFLERSGREAEALPIYDQAMRRWGRRNPWVAHDFGRCLLRVHRSGEAAGMLRWALDRASKKGDAFCVHWSGIHLGTALRELGRLEEAAGLPVEEESGARARKGEKESEAVGKILEGLSRFGIE